ncbi:MAG TPA: germination protein YpeB [Firmicutes bacterium]|nr:germination protein YpeB [Bacillota bacterium]
MEKKQPKLLVAGLLVAVMAGIWGMAQYRERLATERQLAAQYQERFFEAVGHVENVEVLLTKGLLVAATGSNQSEMAMSIFSDIWRQAFSAQAHITQLPVLQGTLMRTSKFLTQVGDFGFAAGKKIAAGMGLTDKERQDLFEFRKEAALLNQALKEIQAKVAGGQMPWEELQQGTNTLLRRKSKEIADNDMVRLEKQAIEFPTIIYDGPFSDHILQQKPKGLTGEPIGEGEAEHIAVKFMAAAGLGEELVAEVIGEVEGDIPAYQVKVRRPGRNEELARLDISRKGGHVVWMMAMRQVGEQKLDLEEAAKAAKEFLVSQGFAHIVPTYASLADGQAVIPFAPLSDNAIIYPDLIKVSVAVDDGSIIGYEAMGYLMQHHERRLPTPKITADQALAVVEEVLTPIAPPQLALIPLPTLDEVLTYEIKGRMADAFLAVYVNALTGKIEEVLQILHTPEGYLAM